MAINERAHSLATILDREVARFDRTQSDLRERMVHAVEVYFVRHRERLAYLTTNLQRGFDQVTTVQNHRFMQLASQLNHFANARLQELREALFAREQQLTRLDPGPWLDAGWTQLFRKDSSMKGQSLKTLNDASVGDEITARLRDGVLNLVIESKQQRIRKESKT
jgi:exonuclease VII large subunit